MALGVSLGGGGGGGGTSVNLKDEGSTVVTGVTEINVVGAGATASGVGTVGTLTIPGLSVWDPDAPFTSPNSRDDEFTAATIDVKWTQINAGSASALNTTDLPGLLRIAKTTNNGTVVALMQSIPAGDFTAFMKVFPVRDGGDYETIGFWVADGVTAGAGNQYRAGLSHWSGRTASVARMSNYSTYTSTTVAGVAVSAWGPYVRLSRSGTTLILDTSPDGVAWERVGTWTSAFGLTHLGLGFLHERGNTRDQAFYDFFRVVDGTAEASLGNTRID
jgi:hypothetical protein